MKSSAGVGVVQIGARNHYLTARALSREGMLQGLYTDAYARAGDWKTRLAMVLSAGNPERANVVAGRKADVPDALVKDAWSITALALLQRMLAGSRGATARDNAALAKALTRFAISNGLSGASSIYGHCSASPELFRYARGQGIKTLLEQASATVATSERIMADEYKRWPGWAQASRQDARLYEERQAEELDLADQVLAPSAFVKRSLVEDGVPEKKIEVVPYGFQARVGNRAPRTGREGGRLRVLYLGNVNLQKGVQYLLEAARSLGPKHFEFRVVGPVLLEEGKLGPYRDIVQFTGRSPRNRTDEHYDWADVFVLPTLCDGFAIVQLEACARGLPLIVTSSCGSVVEDGVQGFVVPPASAGAIVDRLQALKDAPALLSRLSLAASARIAGFSEEVYARRLMAVLRDRAG